MAVVSRALTSNDNVEITDQLALLKQTAKASGLIHESFVYGNVDDFTRAWFAWANSYFAEMILTLLKTHPHLLT
jgi:meiotically up-regulated gene 157 (Mug157) protein